MIGSYAGSQKSNLQPCTCGMAGEMTLNHASDTITSLPDCQEGSFVTQAASLSPSFYKPPFLRPVLMQRRFFQKTVGLDLIVPILKTLYDHAMMFCLYRERKFVPSHFFSKLVLLSTSFLINYQKNPIKDEHEC